jgi:hypothetical protein
MKRDEFVRRATRILEGWFDRQSEADQLHFCNVVESGCNFSDIMAAYRTDATFPLEELFKLCKECA